MPKKDLAVNIVDLAVIVRNQRRFDRDPFFLGLVERNDLDLHAHILVEQFLAVNKVVLVILLLNLEFLRLSQRPHQDRFRNDAGGHIHEPQFPAADRQR